MACSASTFGFYPCNTQTACQLFRSCARWFVWVPARRPRGMRGCVALPARACVRGETRNPPGARGGSTGGNRIVWSGGALLSHTLSGAVPSPCRALASGFGMGPGVSPWPWPPQILSTFPGRTPGGSDRDGPGTGQWTRKKSCDAFRTLPAAGTIRRTQYGPPPGNPDDGV